MKIHFTNTNLKKEYLGMNAGIKRKFFSFSISKMALIVAILAFLSDACNSITQPTVSVLAIRLGASYEFIGTMVAVSSLARLLLVQPVGTLSDNR